MASRLIAAAVVIAGIAAIAWVAATSGTDAVESTAGTQAPTAEAEASSAIQTDPPRDESTTSTTAPAIDPPENLGPRRDLTNLDGWLNADIDSLDDLDGQVVLVEMWTFGCRNCKNRIPHTQDLYATYHDRGFEIVGVHAPEFDYEADIANIEQALVDLGVTWPVALDTDKSNFRSWQAGGRRFWPRTFVIDQSGDVRFDHIGEGAYEELEETVAWLLDNPPA